MRVEDDVWNDAPLRKGQVFSWVEAAHDAFLPATTGKFVTNDWVPLKCRGSVSHELSVTLI